MSRFWAAQSSSEGEKDSDSDSFVEQQQTQRAAGGKFGANFEESESESEDEARVVKSHKDKAWDNMREGITKIRNARRNGDWPLVQDEFNNVNKMIDKSKMLIIKHGLPNFYIKMLGEMEDSVQNALKDKDAIKKMKPVVSRALNQMKLQVRKHNEGYKDQIADFRAHPEKYEEAESEEESEDEDSSDESSDDSDASSESSESSKDKKKKPAAKTTKAAADDSESDDDSLFGGGSVSESSSSEEDERKELTGRAKWLKKVVDPAAEDARQAKREAKKLQAPRAKQRDYDSRIVARTKVQVTYAHDEKITEEELDRRVNELVASRGKKNTDGPSVLRQLEMLTKAARMHGPRKEIPVLMHLISSMFDTHRSIDDFMDLQQWRTCLRSLTRILTLLEQNKKIVLGTISIDELTDLGAQFKPAGFNGEEGEEKAVNPNVVKVVGSIESFTLRLEDEYTKSLQQINPHTQEYVVRLSDEAALIELSEQVLIYNKRINDMKAAAQVALLIVEHTYYKHDTHAKAVQRAHLFNKTWGRYLDLHPACTGKIATVSALGKGKETKLHPASFLGNPTVNPPPYNPTKALEELCQFIYKYADERSKMRAMLCSVYHHALHDRYYRARDLFLMSHIQDFVEKADVKTQILYNRTVAVMGLSAFRLGLFQKAFDCLAGICQGRVKELLAQGQQKYVDKDPEQEKIERRRQIPYHMHINPDLLEACHLICALVLELPNLAREATGHVGGMTVSRTFRKYLQGYGRQIFTGPPENTRDHVLSATQALLNGDWSKALNLLVNLEVWNLIPADGGDKVKTLLRTTVKEEAVRAYVLLNGEYYESMSLQALCSNFEMEEAVIRRLLSRMIFTKEISAAWEEPDILIMYKVEPTPLQTLALSVSEKIGAVLDSNERLLDPLVNSYTYKEDYAQRGDGTRKQWTDKSGGAIDPATAQIQRKYRQNTGWKSSSRPVIARQSATSRTGRPPSNRPGWNNAAKGTVGTNTASVGKSGFNRAPPTESPQQQPRRWGAPVI